MLGRYSRLGVRYSDAAFRAMAFKRGESGDSVSVELAKQVPLGEIRYTVNGTEPNAKSHGVHRRVRGAARGHDQGRRVL